MLYLIQLTLYTMIIQCKTGILFFSSIFLVVFCRNGKFKNTGIFCSCHLSYLRCYICWNFPWCHCCTINCWSFYNGYGLLLYFGWFLTTYSEKCVPVIIQNLPLSRNEQTRYKESGLSRRLEYCFLVYWWFYIELMPNPYGVNFNSLVSWVTTIQDFSLIFYFLLEGFVFFQYSWVLHSTDISD